MQILNAFVVLSAFAARRPGGYFAACCGVGLVIRWFWCGQNLWRFIDPLAPIFR